MTRQDDIRKEILFQLWTTRVAPRPASLLTRQARKQGMDFTESEVRAELIYLADEGLIIEVPTPGTGEKFFRLTSKGVNHYQDRFAA
jgi:DNA-binding PadR family transcriptional regulator